MSIKKIKDFGIYLGFLLATLLVPVICIWFAYEIVFNFDEFTNMSSSTNKQKLYTLVVLAINSVIPYGQYFLAFLHLLVTLPFFKWAYRLTRNTFNF